MRNKGVVITLTVVISLLCFYYLSFTYISRKVQKQAVAYATGSSGVVDLVKKQTYLDSVWEETVYNLFGAQYTYREVKENELSLGLDLQGGMHVTLEVSPRAIIQGLSQNSQDSVFLAALRYADQGRGKGDYVELFYRGFEEINKGRRSLAALFVSSANKERVSLSDTDEAVRRFLSKEVEDAINRSFIILKTRIDQFGASQPNIQRLQGSTGRIQVEIPGADNPQRVRKLLQSVAHLEFWNVVEYSNPSLNEALIATNNLLLEEEKQKAAAIAKSGEGAKPTAANQPPADTAANALEQQLSQQQDTAKSGLDSLTNSNLSALFALSNPSYPFLYKVKDTLTINRILRRPDVKAFFPRIDYAWDIKPDQEITPGVEDLRLYFLQANLNKEPLLTGEVISDARLDYDRYARPAVSMTMNVTGARKWAKITAAAAATSPQGRIAIALDNAVYTAPTVEGEIPNGSSQITGSFTLDEAKDLANVLKAGSLPAPAHIVEEAIIGPTLGKVAQSQGLISAACGLAVVAIFMIVYYSRGGFVADLALLFNIFFILGILAQLNAALTLPGIAGIVLTMGMAVDANVLIYERIKEELRGGVTLREAVKRGYGRAFSSIFDSNVTTLLTGIALFVLGQGPLKGFAIVLIIGIATSFFSAIYISRVVVEWMIRKGDASTISFDSFIARKVGQGSNFNFLKYRRIAYLFSIGMVVVGFIFIAIHGLNLGVDFKGGRSYVVAFSKPIQATEMRVGMAEGFQNASTEVKNYGSGNVLKITTSYLIEESSEEADRKVVRAMVDNIQRITGLKAAEEGAEPGAGHFSVVSSSKVGANIAEDIKQSAYKACLFSLAAIFIYILIRFKKWQFSAGALAATAHDTLFVVASFGILEAFGIALEIDQVFVAALLTVIGYSVNDTVIIFDRIREEVNSGRGTESAALFNHAINKTLSRTLITSGTTLIVVVILLLFGGAVLRSFSFALLTGVVVGTFSSIFVAASAVYDLDKGIVKGAEDEE